jgi:hypothetical protein
MALLYESGFWALTRPRVLVRCERETQVRRAMARDGLDEAAARARVAAQAPPEGKARRSHCVLDNDGTVEELREAAARVLVWGEGEGEREGAGRNGEGEGNGGAPRRRPGSSSSSSGQRRSGSRSLPQATSQLASKWRLLRRLLFQKMEHRLRLHRLHRLHLRLLRLG